MAFILIGIGAVTLAYKLVSEPEKKEVSPESTLGSSSSSDFSSRRRSSRKKRISRGQKNQKKILRDFTLKEHEVKGDGSCQFRALSYVTTGTEDNHLIIRKNICDFLLAHREQYQDFIIGTSFDTYVAKMRRSHTWGDDLTLQAYIDMDGREVILVTTYSDSVIRKIPAFLGRTSQISPIYLSFYAEKHYNALVLS